MTTDQIVMGKPIRVFDPEADYAVALRRLPHWSQAGTVSFIIWRTWDSMPAAVVATWIEQRDAWLRQHRIDPAAKDWRIQLRQLGALLVEQFQTHSSDRWNENLDSCHGACALARPELAQLVTDALRRLDGDQYEITDFVIMPNHVHLLAAFADHESMLKHCESWKKYTAKRLNHALNRKGRFWQQDAFDRLVRSPEQFEYLRKYIAANPRKAKLRAGQFVHYKSPT